ncbi:MAG: FG-GAP-like repeat-containing protein [Chloroflexi bacterium]|nr:FG-GAP-like repeat-containing protein [Chloroflexota bacterium]MCI0576971.1 FG-GAP-like repeat-containing protein [Chloroflexota bacterium]MCI0649367.1 FG-GAP-like repeat-containing protein [Chloroflexota bacterium]MCI0729786.1 FG-GAP-like repeat-containing protein [Chloroflexota bacterium]
MMNKYRLLLLLLLPALLITGALAGRQIMAGDELVIVSIQPAPRSGNVSTGSPIVIEFDRPVAQSSINAGSFMAFGKWSGPVGGAYTFSNLDQTVTLTPDQPFSAGEPVMVVLSNQIEGTDGAPLRSAGYSFHFWTQAGVSLRQMELLDTLSTRTTPPAGTRAYGGTATDLNNDGWLDLTIVNEDSADVRVFLNMADGTGNYHDFIQPTFPVNVQASPNEPADFNGDGNADLVVANISTNSLSILSGNGDGTFDPQQEITVGGQPRGVAVLDADGDGDADIANTNSSGTGNMSLLLNNGSGVFGAPSFFEAGVSKEWALGAADMNEDGIMDLVVGGQTSQQVIVNFGNGNGTFTPAGSAYSVGGAVWMLMVGDVNGDGHEDVSTANGSSNNGAIVLGNGAGGFSAPAVIPTDPFVLATDLADIDGDGDLDWATSSFFGDWNLYVNNGGIQGGTAGTFSFDQAFPATQAASCALMLDFDNDGDLDLALIDEVADEVILMKNLMTSSVQNETLLPLIRTEE